jgi:hypothetical protein
MSQGWNNLNLNNIYKNWIQEQIETANARGLMGGQTPGQIINQNLVRPIDNIMNQARVDMRNPNRGVPVGNQGLVGRGPTSISTPKQLPAATTGGNIANPNARMPKVQPRVNTPNVINMYPSNDVKLLTYDPTKTIVDTSLGKQTMFKLPNGTYTSNLDLVKIAEQQMAKAAKLAKANKANALMMFPELMNLWYGVSDVGGQKIKGVGRTVLEQTPWGNFIYGNKGTLTPEMIAGMQSTKAFLNKSGNKPRNGNDNNTGISIGTNIKKGNGSKGGQATTQAQALALAQQLGSKPPIANQQEADAQQANINAINDYVSKLQEINRPYIDALQNYSDRYDDLVKNNFNTQRYFTAMAGLTGNNNYARLADSINPLVTEAAKIDLQKKIQDAQAGDLNAINEIMGNLAMAQEMGLPPEAAFANKNLLTMMAARDREANKYQIALENNLMKKYGIDRNYARALTVQAMRGQNALDVASIYTGAYGNGGGVAPGLNKQGTVSNVASMDAMLQAAHNKNNR